LNAVGNPAETRRALGVLAAFAVARLVFMATLGLGRDEAYTLVVSRRLALSYFDHPPLHQWLAHFAALALGETVWARSPFVALFALAGFALYELTRRLYDARAGFAALIALNVTPFFFASAGSWIVPDGPLLAALAIAALALERLCLETPAEREVWTLWLAVGAAFGLAGLSKYSATLTALGALAFLTIEPGGRRWLRHPAPYVAAALAVAIVAPVFVWNADHGWASFRFQGGRGAPSNGLDPLAVIGMALGEVGYLLPWTFAALVAVSLAAARRGDGPARLLICLAAPPILVFTITPLWGGRGLPHWTMPGWFFLYPLLGEWLARAGYGRRTAGAASAFLAALALLTVTQTRFGWIERIAGDPLPDPTLELLDWGLLRDAPGLNPRPAFVAATKWWEAGKVGVALGPDVPVFVFSDDPRGVAFLDRGEDFVGRDGVIVTERRRLADVEGPLAAYFTRLGPPEPLALGRGGLAEEELVIVPAYGLTHAFPVPYPLGRR
jgi:hypothetical protein